MDIPQNFLLAAQSLDDFDSWQKLVSLTENLPTKDDRYPVKISQGSPDTLKRLLFIVYENLLTNFPFCEQYWCNYASWKYKLGDTAQEVTEIYLKALKFLPKSLIIWKNYIHFTLDTSPSPETILDTLEQARINIGHHFYSNVIFDPYLDFLRSSGRSKEYHLLLRRIIELPLYHYCKYFQEFLRLLEKADIESIKYFISDEDLKTYFKGTSWGDLLSSDSLRDLKMRLKKQFTDVFIATQYQVYQIWPYERSLKKQFHQPGKLLSRGELNTWNSYLVYLEAATLRDKDQKSSIGKATLRTVYERCLIRTSDYTYFWLKCSNWRLNMNQLEEAKQVLLKGIYCTRDSGFRLRLRLIDLDILSGNLEDAVDLAVEGIQSSPNSLEMTIKLIEMENLKDPTNVLTLTELKLDEVKGSKYESQFDYLFREVLTYSQISVSKLESFFRKYTKSKKNSYQYLRALIDFYRCYDQNGKGYEEAMKMIEDSDEGIRERIKRFVSDDEGEYFEVAKVR
ncbi:DEKNAAC100984 [Brettanomyces naardenensis]|uniref:DEKNAAC100984 n=1 Tax=Brettanomyces naardenensis TaxID=13370 RepID=A0A448YGV7_BRENA|nr:DEKNAAC100984 [Brettanomyces naardenensis]